MKALLLILVFLSSNTISAEPRMPGEIFKMEQISLPESDQLCPDPVKLPLMLRPHLPEHASIAGCTAERTSLGTPFSDQILLTKLHYWYKSGGYIGLNNLQVFLVFKKRSADTAELLWGDFIDDPLPWRLKQADIIEVDKRHFLVLEYFTGGTAGFWKEFFEITENGLRYLQSNSLSKCFPKGYSAPRGIQVDLSSKSARANLTTKDECSACASKQVLLKLRIEDTRIDYSSCTFSDIKHSK